MQQDQGSKVLVENATKFDTSLNELRDFGSQLYHAADYCEKTFKNAQHKKIVLETTKEYISQAVVAMVDHLGSISANLEHCISQSNYVPETQNKIDNLRQRIGTCQQYSNRLAIPRLRWTGEFSRYHCRYPSLTLHSAARNAAVSRDPESCTDGTNEKKNQSKGTEQQLVTDCKPSLLEENKGLSPSQNTFRGYKNAVPVHDGLLISLKAKHSAFQFEVEEVPNPKRHTVSWKLKHNKAIKMLIRRGKRVLS